MKKAFHLFAVVMCSVLMLAVVSCQEKDNPEKKSTSEEKSDNISSSQLQAVDLGLPIKWANMNVGATKPEEYGDYFAWGETSPKTTYTWSTYFDTKDGGETFIKYNNKGKMITLDIEDDAAHVNLGGDWRMPTIEDFDLLCSGCDWTWTTKNGVWGAVISSRRNSNSIFLPAAGCREYSSLYDYGSFGNYWTSTSSSDGNSMLFRFYEGYVNGRIIVYTYPYYWNRYIGHSVRAVCPQPQ